MSSTSTFPNTQTVADAGKEALNRAADTASQIAGQASELGRQAIDRLDASRASVAEGLERTADAIRTQVPDHTRTVANALGKAAGYVRSRDLRAMGSDLTVAVRRNPRESLIAAAAAGFLLGAIMRRSD